jgi:hypothetical protein
MSTSNLLLVSECAGGDAFGMVISLLRFTLPMCCHSFNVSDCGSSDASLEEDSSW